MEESTDPGSTDTESVAPLFLSGGGTTSVATDELYAHAAMLLQVSIDAESWCQTLDRIRVLNQAPAPAWSSGDPGLETFALARAVDDIAVRTRSLAHALEEAAEGYGGAERAAQLLARMGAAGFLSALGHLAPFLALMAIPAVTSGAVAWLLASLVTGTAPGETPGRLAKWVTDNPRLLTNPLLVSVVRALVSSGDDAVGGALSVPFPVSLALGEDGAGLFSVATTAGAVLGVTRTVGVLRETPTNAQRSGTGPRSPPPSGVADLARRIPSSSGVGPQIRIERYGAVARPAWVVYVGGTAAWSPVAGKDPWDMTSNVAAVAEQSSGSYRAVVEAMHEAGVSRADPVIGVGHSQGGLLVAQLAASEEFNTVALATFGAPAGQVMIPDAVPVIAAEHSDDLVPALGGAPRDTTGEGNHHVVVRREVFADRDPPPGEALPAHRMDRYRETAAMIDASPENRLNEFRSVLRSTVGSAPGEATFWRATREVAD